MEGALAAPRALFPFFFFRDFFIHAKLARVAIQDIILTRVGKNHELIGNFRAEATPGGLGRFGRKAQP